MMPSGSVVFVKFNVLFFSLIEMCQAARVVAPIGGGRSQEKVSIYFSGIPIETREIAALKIVYGKPSLSEYYTVQLHNIILE